MNPPFSTGFNTKKRPSQAGSSPTSSSSDATFVTADSGTHDITASIASPKLAVPTTANHDHGPNLESSVAAPVNMDHKKRKHRASSADGIIERSVVGLPVSTSPRRPVRKPRRTHTAIAYELTRIRLPWPDQPKSSDDPRDHLALRPTQAQFDFLHRQRGYNGFYHIDLFKNGTEPYGYPHRDLPRFLGGELPDRMSQENLLAMHQWGKVPVKSSKAAPKKLKGRRRENVDDGDGEQ